MLETVHLVHARYLLAALAVAAMAATVSVAGCSCGSSEVALWCDDPVGDHYNSAGDFDPCCCDDTCVVSNRQPRACWGKCPIDEPHCPLNPDAGIALEVCQPRLPGWSAPLWVWTGPGQVSPPSCPTAAPRVAFDGTDAPSGAPATGCTCPACGAPSGSCLPTTITAYTEPQCSGSAPEPFDPPAGWDGSCTTLDAIIAGVASYSIGPAPLIESCGDAVQPTPQITEATWTVTMRACAPTSACASGDPSVMGPPDGFTSCIAHEGDVACPDGSLYEEQTLFYRDVEDTRSCAMCFCAAPSPSTSTCIAEISFYPSTNVVCSLSGPQSTQPSDPATTQCYSGLPPDFAGGLAAKSATVNYNNHGQSCTAVGGGPSGGVQGIDPVTLCCLRIPTYQ